jgi:hypothetical protein
MRGIASLRSGFGLGTFASASDPAIVEGHRNGWIESDGLIAVPDRQVEPPCAACAKATFKNDWLNVEFSLVVKSE